MKRILFNDDEAQVLSGLQRMLYPFRHEWEMVFASSGVEALRLLSESAFDVLVTDIRMPGMNGIELLSEAAKLHPDVLRIVLSGTADYETTLRSVELAHQYLVKPCEPKVLRTTIERAFNLRLILEDSSLRKVVSSMRSLPSLPSVYGELMTAIASPDAGPAEIGSIVSRDIGMVSKVLQLVNSSFFGPRQAIVDPVAAVVYLGSETIQALAVQVAVFSQFNNRAIPEFSIDALQAHSLRVAAGAKLIAKNAGLDRSAVNDCAAGGFLHDIGRLILASNFPERYRAVLQQSVRYGVPVRVAERDEFGTSHAEVGAYLLRLWGLPDVLTEIVGLHHSPPVDPGGQLSRVAAVYIADIMDLADPAAEGEAGCRELVHAAGRHWEELTAGVRILERGAH